MGRLRTYPTQAVHTVPHEPTLCILCPIFKRQIGLPALEKDGGRAIRREIQREGRRRREMNKYVF